MPTNTGVTVVVINLLYRLKWEANRLVGDEPTRNVSLDVLWVLTFFEFVSEAQSLGSGFCFILGLCRLNSTRVI